MTQRIVPLFAAALAALVLAGCGGRAPAPAASPAPAATTPAPAPAPSGAAVTGHFVVVGDQSNAEFHAREKFVDRDLPNDAIGKTNAIKGEVTLDAKGATASSFSVDLSKLSSDKDRRDSYIKRNTLAVSTYPNAEFTIKPGAGAIVLADGQSAQFTLPGTFKVHGITKDVVWNITATKQGDSMLWNGTLDLKLSDYGMKAPDLANLLKVEDAMRLVVSVALKAG